MRERIAEDVKAAMKSGDKCRLATLRLVTAAIKDRDLGAGIDESGKPTGRDKISDQEILSLLQKMIKQRRDSIAAFSAAKRDDLVAVEEAEIAVIEGYLPTPMNEAEQAAAIAALLKEIGATGLKDMGRAMTALKDRYTGRMDFARASVQVKKSLAG